MASTLAFVLFVRRRPIFISIFKEIFHKLRFFLAITSNLLFFVIIIQRGFLLKDLKGPLLENLTKGSKKRKKVL